MSNPRKRKPPPAKSIFINCPFDEAYRPILRSIVFAVIVAGYHPRCALDSMDGAEIRVSEIANMIGECDWGIHDLSRVEVEPEGLPRFNMPMELGIHLGARLLGERRHLRKRALILDSKHHRYDQALSDISGQDIESHDNDPNEAIRCVRNWLSEHRPRNARPLPSPKAIRHEYHTFLAELDTFANMLRLDPNDLSHSDFVYLGRFWIEVTPLLRPSLAS
jgi:hypothetical protein